MSRFVSRFWRFCTEWTVDRKRNVKMVTGCAAFATVCISCTKNVPPGHVGLLEDWNGNMKPHIFDDTMTYVYLPIYQRPISFRVTPVKKKFIKEYKTKDGKTIEIVLQMRLQPKIPYAIEIYSRFGKDYAKRFVEQEASLDVSSVVAQHTFEELVANNENTDLIVDKVIERFKDACIFHRVRLSEASIIFRDPEDVDAESE
ncbi:putative prohibitin family protein [Cardiosporidium cionae]|uniref:Prohibitin n=1 Tax=Cardiosporidium cionae TaxID=476202 RepID=A0ABQ7JCV9_9APIC|nr:putative prohibitin family protein [Cardiosporidium cionae]|eukprot:KAF8821455.1 putative prohibitin family protein [Cardiosporidium cionae]